MLKFFKKHWVAILTFLLSIIAVLVIIILGLKGIRIIANVGESQDIDRKAYQAVFLDNNQIYFGHLERYNSQFSVLKDVHYVQLTDKISEAGVQSGRLVRLGEIETHGPQNEMIINRDHILFIENLRSDSKVVQTINSLKTQSR